MRSVIISLATEAEVLHQHSATLYRNVVITRLLVLRIMLALYWLLLYTLYRNTIDYTVQLRTCYTITVRYVKDKRGLCLLL